MAKLPVNLSKAMDAWKEVSAKADESGGILLAGDPRLVELAQGRFSAGGTVPATWVGPISGLGELTSGPGEVLVVLTYPEQEVEILAVLAEKVPKGGAVVVVDEGAAATGRVTRPCPRCARISFSDSSAGWRQVLGSCAEVAGEHVVGLGRRYPVIREAAAQRVVFRTARQNALIALVFFLPGADMPAMTLNQLKMVLSVAGIYGESIDLERAVELAGVVAMAFGFRSAARRLVRSIPGLGWILRPIVGYAATVAVGMGTIQYYEKGAPASTSRVVAFAGNLRR